jgi:hypothetical protein
MSLSRRKQGFESPRERQLSQALMDLELGQRPSIVHPVFDLSASHRDDASLPPGYRNQAGRSRGPSVSAMWATAASHGTRDCTLLRRLR